MSADALSQQEIDALLKGADEGSEDSGEAPAGSSLDGDRAAAFGAYAELMASTQAEMLGTFLATEAKVSREEVETSSGQELVDRTGESVVLCKFLYEGALGGPTALVFKEADAAKIGGTMVGDSSATGFSEMVADAFKEAINTILGNLNTTLGAKAGGTVSTGQVEVEKCAASAEAFTAAAGGDDPLIVVPYTLAVGEDLQSEFWQVFSGTLVDSLTVLVAPPPGAEPAAATRPTPQGQATPVEFETLTEEPHTAAPPNLNLIMDIGLGVRVELGRTHMKIRDILNLGSGSVVELDKLAGEPVDLLVNDVIFAKGEVVVIDENFGARITDILSLGDRIKTLGERKT